MNEQQFSPDVLSLDCAKEVERISQILRETVLKRFKKRGVVVALSGGIDSSVAGALSVEAFGKEHVFGLLMPEKDSSEETLQLSSKIADHFGIQRDHEDITPILESAGCYRRRDEAIQSVISEYTPEYSCKIVLPSVLDSDSFRIFSVVVRSPEGKEIKARLPRDAYLQVVAASNFKQRVRKMLEYYHADRLNYAVVGTPNRLEYDQGFFVKLGDGAADVKPIAHLYKSQVYQLAAYLGVPEEIRTRQPTTDTYSMAQSQEEFFFSLPYDKMDLCLYARNNGITEKEVADVFGLEEKQIERVFRDIDQKRKTTQYLHAPPVLVDEITEVKH